MNNDKYVAMDVHKASVVYAMRDASGKVIGTGVLETKAQTLREFVRGLSGTIHLPFEEGTQSAWLKPVVSINDSERVACQHHSDETNTFSCVARGLHKRKIVERGQK
jgi:hypothetical protein